MTDAAALVEVDQLTVRRHQDTLLDRVSLHVRRGSLHVIVGPNGAGKSTLFGAILGQNVFDGRILLHWTGSGAIGYVPQTFTVDATLPVTVEDFLALTRQRRPVCLGLGATTRRRIHDLLARVDLTHLATRPLAVLSGGELRRVLLAHALDPEPELLLLDEPTSGLDEASGRWLEDTLTSIGQSGRTTILMISHDLEQVRRLAHTVTVLDRRIIAEGAPQQVLTTASVLDLLPARGRQAH